MSLKILSFLTVLVFQIYRDLVLLLEFFLFFGFYPLIFLSPFRPSPFPEVLEEDHGDYYYDHHCARRANGHSQEEDLREGHSVHHAEPDGPYQTIDVRWVLHLAGISPIVIELQLPEDDGDIVPLRVPIPDHPVLEPSAHGSEGIHMIVEHKLLTAPISRAEIPCHCQGIAHRGKAGESAF